MTQRDLTNIDIVVYALLKLEGYKRKVHTEEVAYEAYRLAGDRFGWNLKRYRDMGFPDKELVRINLKRAEEQGYAEGRSGVEYGRRGSTRAADGWSLTAAGAGWIRDNEDRIGRALGEQRGGIHPREAARFRKELENEPLFRRFQSGELLAGTETHAFTNMINVSPDAPNDVIRRKFERMRSTARLVGDQQAVDFLEACASTFAVLLATETAGDSCWEGTK